MLVSDTDYAGPLRSQMIGGQIHSCHPTGDPAKVAIATDSPLDASLNRRSGIGYRDDEEGSLEYSP